MSEDEDNFWSSSSVSSKILSHSSNNDNDDYIYKTQEQKTYEYEFKKILLPNLGYSHKDKSFFFKFNTNSPKEINGCIIPKIVNINLRNTYNNINIDNMTFYATPLKEENYGGLIVDIKYLKSGIITDKIFSYFGKKIELYLLELPIDDCIYTKLGIENKTKKEDIDFCFQVRNNRNKKINNNISNHNNINNHNDTNNDDINNNNTNNDDINDINNDINNDN
jgi:hypothetical protein